MGNDTKDIAVGTNRPFQRFMKPGRRRRKRKSAVFCPEEFDFSCQNQTRTWRNLLEGEDAVSRAAKLIKSLPFLPSLLFEREIYGPHGKRSKVQPSWKHRLQMQDQEEPHHEENDVVDETSNKTNHRIAGQTAVDSCWREYCRAKWKFRELQTPASDAVLALNAQGTMLIALHCGTTAVTTTTTRLSSLLSLRVYGMAAKTNKQAPAALLFSLPLQVDDGCRHGDRTGVLQQHYYSEDLDDDSTFLLSEELDIPAPARVPVRIWWSQDDRLGIVMYRTSKADGLATVMVFSTTITPDYSTIWRLRNIPIQCQSRLDVNAANDASFLWNVNYIPCHGDDRIDHAPTDAFLSSTWMRMEAYLFLIDEGDGFRMAWIRDAAWIWNDRKQEPVQRLWSYDDNNIDELNVVRSNANTRIVVRILDGDSEWLRHDESTQPATLHISFHAFFSTSSLLHSILSRNPRLVSPKFDASAAVLPNYFDYHIVEITHGGRCLELFLIFSVGGGSFHHNKGCVGVFCQVDILTQDYRTIKWIRLTQVDTPPMDCGCVALAQRRKYLMDHRLQEQQPPQQKRCHHHPVAYPDAIAIHNIAVRRLKAVASISARDMPVVLSYI